jgi:hypothetical protein
MIPSVKLFRRIGARAYAVLLAEIIADDLRVLWLRTETKSAEVMYGLIAFGWAMLLFHADTTAAKSLSGYLSEVAPANVWQWFLAVLAGSQLFLALYEQNRLVALRLVTWFASMAWWSYMCSISILEVPPALFFAVLCGVLAFGSFWAVTRTLER